MIIAQVILRLPAMNGHFKMCSFPTCCGGGGVWPPFASHSATWVFPMEFLDWSDCGLWSHGPLILDGCANLLYRILVQMGRTGTRCRKRASQICPAGDMSGEHAGHAGTGTFSASLHHYYAATWGDEQHDSGSQRLAMVSLWVQKVINEIHLFSMALTCACPYINHTVSTGHLVHNVDISKLLTHTNAIRLVKCLGGWSQTVLEVKPLDGEVLECGYMSSGVLKLGGGTAKFPESPLEMAYDREMNIQFVGKRSVASLCNNGAP